MKFLEVKLTELHFSAEVKGVTKIYSCYISSCEVILGSRNIVVSRDDICSPYALYLERIIYHDRHNKKLCGFSPQAN
jgi:hypothetical protein